MLPISLMLNDFYQELAHVQVQSETWCILSTSVMLIDFPQERISHDKAWCVHVLRFHVSAFSRVPFNQLEISRHDHAIKCIWMENI